MLTQKQINQIREHLEKAQNPVFFFDNDPDGLCSFLLLQRHIGRGKGIPIKTFPSLDANYFRKVYELKADYIFILDKPVVSEEFFKRAEQINIPVVWIDHHLIDEKTIPKFVNYYNPVLVSGESEPVTYICYKISSKEEDMWLAIVGCIADGFLPDFYKEFEKIYPDLSTNAEGAFDVLYGSAIGKIIRILGNGLKDKTSNVVSMLKFLIKVKSPYEILEENPKNYLMYQRYKQIEKKYQVLLSKAKRFVENSKKILFFMYGGELSISAELSNELSYRYPKKIIVVAYIKGGKANISVRGKKIREAVIEAVKELEGASAGGHENAVGAQVRVEDLEKFKENLIRII